MTDFQQRLEKAITRGTRRSDAKAKEAREKALSQEELKRLHTQHRLQLSEQIEQCLGKLPSHFPGFQYETVYGERGWGAACQRDDVGVDRSRRRTNFYSRIEVTVRPLSQAGVLELAGKATIRNKEVFNRTHYEKLAEVDPESFAELVDIWVLEFAELFAATG